MENTSNTKNPVKVVMCNNPPKNHTQVVVIEGSLAWRERTLPACGRTAKMGPAWPPMGGSSRVWEQPQRRLSLVSPSDTPVKVVGPRERPLLMISTPELAHNGRYDLRGSLDPGHLGLYQLKPTLELYLETDWQPVSQRRWGRETGGCLWVGAYWNHQTSDSCSSLTLTVLFSLLHLIFGTQQHLIIWFPSSSLSLKDTRSWGSRLNGD